MQTTTGCKINVSPASGRDIEREIGLVGSRGAIEAAKRAIMDKVHAVVSGISTIMLIHPPSSCAFAYSQYRRRRIVRQEEVIVMISTVIVIRRITSNHLDSRKMHHLLKLPMLKVPKVPNLVNTIRMLHMAGITPILRSGGPTLRNNSHRMVVRPRLGQHRPVVDLSSDLLHTRRAPLHIRDSGDFDENPLYFLWIDLSMIFSALMRIIVRLLR